MNLKSSEDSIKKSNELSIAELNHGLSLNQMQLLAYAIYSTQKTEKQSLKNMSFKKSLVLNNTIRSMPIQIVKRLLLCRRQ